MLYRIPRQKIDWALLNAFCSFSIDFRRLIRQLFKSVYERVWPCGREIPVVFEHSSDEYEVVLNDSLSVSLPPWGKLGLFN